MKKKTNRLWYEDKKPFLEVIAKFDYKLRLSCDCVMKANLGASQAVMVEEMLFVGPNAEMNSAVTVTVFDPPPPSLY